MAGGVALSGYGLAVRWDLHGCGPEVAQALRDFVAQTSIARFSAMPGLRSKTWRMREGEWFEGTYVWETPEARAAFAEHDRAGTADSPGTRIVGSPPVAYEEFEVVGVAEGPSGFVAGPGPGSA